MSKSWNTTISLSFHNSEEFGVYLYCINQRCYPPSRAHINVIIPTFYFLPYLVNHTNVNTIHTINGDCIECIQQCFQLIVESTDLSLLALKSLQLFQEYQRNFSYTLYSPFSITYIRCLTGRCRFPLGSCDLTYFRKMMLRGEPQSINSICPAIGPLAKLLRCFSKCHVWSDGAVNYCLKNKISMRNQPKIRK